MSSYATLSEYWKQGDFALVTIDAIPRSMSTALSIALSEIIDGQINEVFNRGVSDLEHSAKQLINKINEVEDKADKLEIVSKNISSEIQHGDFNKWLIISGLVIFTVRDPVLQMQSLIERIGNDKLAARGGDILSYEDLTKEKDRINKLLSKDRFKRSSWLYTKKHYEIVKSIDKPYLILDGTLLSLYPATHMKLIARKLSRDYSDSSVFNWSTAARDKFDNPNHFDSDYDERHISTNAWVNHANQSTRFQPDTRKRKSLSVFTKDFPDIGNFIKDWAYPIYFEMLRDNNFIYGSFQKYSNTNDAVSPIVEHCKNPSDKSRKLLKEHDKDILELMS